MIECEYCGQKFTLIKNMRRHLSYCRKHSSTLEKDLPKCAYCGKIFSRPDVADHHAKSCRMGVGRKRCGGTVNDVLQPLIKKQRCDICEIDVNNIHTHLRSILHKNKACIQVGDDEYVQIIKHAYKSRIATYRVFSPTTFLTPNDFMHEVKDRVIRLIIDKQEEIESAVKVNLELFAEYTKWVKVAAGEEKEVEEVKSFNTKNKTVFPAVDNDDAIIEMYETFLEEISSKADEFQERDSGWAIKNVLYLEININKYAPLKGSSYLPLPDWIQKKQACINIKNNDDACFFWAIVSALYPAAKHTDRTSSYPPYQEVVNKDGISLPVDMKNINKFEDMNDISINIYEISKHSIAGPIYHTKKRRDKHINLLLVENGERAHFCWIKSLSRLVSSQQTRHNGKMWMCDGCLLPFNKESSLIAHNKQDCSHIMTTLPAEEEQFLKFKNFQNRMKVPIVVYADFEALLIPIDSCSPNPSSSYTDDYQMHEPYSFGYFIKCNYNDSLSKYISYRGNNCTNLFLKSLKEELTPFANTLNRVVPIHLLTSEQILEFESAVNCHICGEKLDVDRVIDHCHLTGEYRGAAHNHCNLNYQIKHVIPIVLHNLSKYDSHFIIRTLQNHNVNILPKNKENFISFTSKKHEGLSFDLRFIDSYRFLAASLDKLASNLDPSQFVNMRKHCSEHLDLLMRKGVFPYDYITSIDKLEETSLPPQISFFNKLNNSNISLKQYEHAQTVWKAFNVKTLGEYSDVYLKTDVLLLTDVFENFRDVCLNTYHLDPAHYYTAPGLSWDAMLQFTKVEMELLTDLSMIKFISNGIRGGMSQCCGRYAKANNKYIRDYDLNKPSNFIIYLDANNQYGWAMSQYLPLRDFRWLSESEIRNFDVMQILNDSATGYILEVDLDYPTHLHDLHNDLCFCPENRIPEVSKSKCQKLLSTLYCKRKYAIHYVNLKQVIEKGLILKKIYRVLAFSQSPWLKGYIDMNTEMRAYAKNAFEKDFYKLMNNAVFGKTMENVDKRVDVRLVNRWESAGKRMGARALISRLNFHSCTVINEDLTIIQMRRSKVKYDKPIYVGFTVLELSKTLMYDFHYNYILPKYGEKASLLYTDTDSFIYNIKTDDFYADIQPDLKKRFDTSDFPSNNIYNLPLVNKKVVGMFKDECAGEMISEFIGIRSKCYFIRKESDEEIKKIKGVKRNVVVNEVFRDDFFKCVNGAEVEQYRTMRVIRSKAHKLYSQTLNKSVLKNSDEKRFTILGEPYKTLAWGHFTIDTFSEKKPFIEQTRN